MKENDVEYEYDFDVDDIRFRTFRVFKNVELETLCNGDIVVLKKLVGRVVAVTIPVDADKNYFYADFAFCSAKDKYSKAYGKNLAFSRLMEKINKDEDVYIIQKSFDSSITDALREIISIDFNEITWLRDVTVNDIM